MREMRTYRIEHEGDVVEFTTRANAEPTHVVLVWVDGKVLPEEGSYWGYFSRHGSALAARKQVQTWQRYHPEWKLTIKPVERVA